MAVEKHDWPTLRTEYVTGESPSLLAFAKGHGINYSLVQKKATKEKWQLQRVEYRDKVAARKTDKLVEQAATWQATSAKDIDREVHVTATLGLKRVLQALAKDPDKPLAGLTLKLLAEALEKFYRLKRESAGLSPNKLPEELDLEGEEAEGILMQAGVLILPALTDQ